METIQAEKVRKVTRFGNQFDITVKGETHRVTTDGLPFGLPRDATGGAKITLDSSDEVLVWWTTSQVEVGE